MKKTTLFTLLGSSALLSSNAIKVQEPVDFQERIGDWLDSWGCDDDVPENCLTSSNFCGIKPKNCIYTNACTGKPYDLHVESDNGTTSYTTALYNHGQWLQIVTYAGPYSPTYPTWGITHV